ncbi:MAG: ABC transporter permease [Candidatus Cloacimonetes bacterium]|nr:ABC transporter permease [Candidatus Cloacimonadota bacterium]
MKLTRIFSLIGEFTIFTKDTLISFIFIFKRRAICINQFKKIGYDSTLLIVVTSAFTGLVSALQASYQTKGFIPQSLISVMISKMVMIELAPVLTSLVFAGKVGATISAEIGSMKVTEQIDALETMSVNPYEYLYMPKLVASLTMLPILTIISIFVTIMFAFVFSNQVFHITSYTFFVNMKAFFEPLDLWIGLIKAFVFGFIIVSIANFNGARTKNGAEGVGIATTNTVVSSSIGILMTDFLVAQIIFGGFA